MRYDELRDVVATRKPGWEHLQEVLHFLWSEQGDISASFCCCCSRIRVNRLRILCINSYVCHIQALQSIDPARAKDDPIIVRNIPYYRAKKALEAEVMKLDAPPRPQNWGVCSYFFICSWLEAILPTLMFLKWLKIIVFSCKGTT